MTYRSSRYLQHCFFEKSYWFSLSWYGAHKRFHCSLLDLSEGSVSRRSRNKIKTFALVQVIVLFSCVQYSQAKWDRAYSCLSANHWNFIKNLCWVLEMCSGYCLCDPSSWHKYNFILSLISSSVEWSCFEPSWSGCSRNRVEPREPREYN